MNKTWTEEQTKESVRRQKKALYIAIPIITALFFLLIYITNDYIYGDVYQMQYKELIEGGYLSADHTQYEFFDFCDRIYDTPLQEKFFHICTWID